MSTISHPINTMYGKLSNACFIELTIAAHKFSKWMFYGAAYSNFDCLNQYADFIKTYMAGEEL